MRYFAIAIAVLLAAFTVLAMIWEPSFVETALASAGPISIYPFDVVLGLAVLALLAHAAFSFRPDPVPLNRLVVWLCVAYLGYEVFVVLPAAILLHSMGPIDVLRAQENRFALVLVLVVYGLILRYCRPALLVTIMDIAAVILVLWALYLYLKGGQGSLVDGRYSVRVVWGGATLLFGWLFFTSLFYWPLRWWRFALAVLAVGGILLANHRSGFVALAAAFVVQMAATGRLTRRVVFTIVVIAVVGAGVYYAAPSVRASAEYSLRTMFNSTSDANAQDRVVRSRLGFEYFVQHPLGDYIWNHRYYLVNVNYDFAPHNLVIQLLVIQGIVASVLIFGVIGVTGCIGWRNRRDQASAAMLTYLTFYVVFCLFNTNIDQLENQALFAVVVGLILYRNRALVEAPEAPAALPVPETVGVSASA